MQNLIPRNHEKHKSMEVAGLIIGGVGIAALFDSCMNAFEYVDVGKGYGSDYQKSALRISLLQLRLSRWSKNVRLTESTTGADRFDLVATPEQVEKVQELLGTILTDFEDAERASHRYKLKDDMSMDNSVHGNTTDALTTRVRTMSLRRHKQSSFRQKATWALQDQKKFKRLIEDLQEHITALIDLFPSQASEQRLLAVQDAQELVQPFEVEEPLETANVRIATLKAATAEVDDILGEAVKIAAANAISGDRFTNFHIGEKAKVQFGNFVATGFTGSKIDRPASSFDQVLIDGSAKVQYGDNYGGTFKGVFED